MGDVSTVGKKLTDYLFKVLIFHLCFFFFETLANISNIALAIKRVTSLQ